MRSASNTTLSGSISETVTTGPAPMAYPATAFPPSSAATSPAASGNFPKFDPLLLMDKGSLYFQRTKMNHFVRNRQELEEISGQLMDLVSAGTIRIEISKSYALEDARQAHIDMENRKTTGSVIYLP